LINITHSSGNYDERYQFTGKIKDEESGFNFFGSRYYYSDLGIFISTDPHWFNYPQLTPYNYAANNPIMCKDVDGNDIIVLLAPKGANGNGHMGILIGNDKDGWTYMSKDGTTTWYPFNGPSKFTERNNIPTVTDFQKSPNIIRDGKPYEQGIRFTTDTDQDNTAKAKMKESGESWYSLLFNNCADAVSDALKSVELNPGWSVYGNYTDPIYGQPQQINDKNPIPNDRFSKIAENNNGTIIPLAPIEQNNSNTTLNSFEIKP
jgi:RHS repeat-associated protein